MMRAVKVRFTESLDTWCRDKTGRMSQKDRPRDRTRGQQSDKWKIQHSGTFNILSRCTPTCSRTPSALRCCLLLTTTTRPTDRAFRPFTDSRIARCNQRGREMINQQRIKAECAGSSLCLFPYLQGFGGGSQLRHRVVVRHQVGQLALRVQGRQRGQRLLQLTDPFLLGLDEEEEKKRKGNRNNTSEMSKEEEEDRIRGFSFLVL